MPLRSDTTYANDYGMGYDADPEFAAPPRRQALRVSLRGSFIPRTLWGRIASGTALLCAAAAAVAGALWVRSFLLHDEHFIVPSASAIQIADTSHLTRAQLMSIFGEDVDRSVFNIPLEQRRSELEGLPWVAHATVMRLLPNRVRVEIVERTPVAFVRQGNQVGLVDANGALFDLPGPDMQAASEAAGEKMHYSFPVLSGVSAADPLSTRAARMKIYAGFMAALDAEGEGISRQVSEVNLENPEDVQAIIPDTGAGGSNILIHFGEDKFLDRYHQYREHLAEWRAQYPKLASVDMRYDQQAVLQMQKDAVLPVTVASAPAAVAAVSAQARPAKSAVAIPPRPEAKFRVSRAARFRPRATHSLASPHNSAQAVSQ